MYLCNTVILWYIIILLLPKAHLIVTLNRPAVGFSVKSLRISKSDVFSSGAGTRTGRSGVKGQRAVLLKFFRGREEGTCINSPEEAGESLKAQTVGGLFVAKTLQWPEHCPISYTLN